MFQRACHFRCPSLGDYSWICLEFPTLGLGQDRISKLNSRNLTIFIEFFDWGTKSSVWYGCRQYIQVSSTWVQFRTSLLCQTGLLECPYSSLLESADLSGYCGVLYASIFSLSCCASHGVFKIWSLIRFWPEYGNGCDTWFFSSRYFSFRNIHLSLENLFATHARWCRRCASTQSISEALSLSVTHILPRLIQMFNWDFVRYFLFQSGKGWATPSRNVVQERIFKKTSVTR